MLFSFEEIISWLTIYKYIVLLPIAIAEGPIISILAGLLCASGKMNFFIAWAILVLGDLIGDLLYYAAGRWGRNKLVARYGKYVGITPKRIEWAEGFFDKHAKKTLLFGKWTQSFGMLILVTAGAVKQNLKEFTIVNFLATIPKSFFFLIIGYYFGASYNRLNSYFNWIFLVTLAVGIALLCIFLWIRKSSNEYFKKN